jgi:hypothetical protein
MTCPNGIAEVYMIRLLSEVIRMVSESFCLAELALNQLELSAKTNKK